METNKVAEQKRAPVYIPFKTFLTAIETLEAGLPPSIDRSVWPTFSGGLQSQILGAFKFLGLIKEDGSVEQRLEQLIGAKGDKRKEVLCGILREKYAAAIELAARNASFQNLQEYFRTSYKLKNGTLYRVIRFYLDACSYAGEKQSSHWVKAKKRAKALAKRGEKGLKEKPPEPKVRKKLKPNVRTIGLQSGGMLSLSVSVDLMSLSKTDREWLFALIDQLNMYEQSSKDRSNDSRFNG
jgi:hypothetical protein